MQTSLQRVFAAALVVAAAGLGFPTVAGANERGEELFALCAQCHGVDGSGNRQVGAPAIAGIDEWYVKNQLKGFRAGFRGRHFDDLMGMRMRPMALTIRSDEDVDALAAYVGSMPKTHPEPQLEGGDPERGKQLYTPCIACHAQNGQGNQALFAPPVAAMSDWYLLTQLRNFKAGVRGAAPGDQYGALMRPMSMTLPDEQAMKDVIAHIMTLSE